MGKMIKLVIIYLFICMGIVNVSAVELEQASDALFTREELQIIEQLGSEITLGYVRGQEINYKNDLKSIFEDELAMTLKVIEYPTKLELETAALSGEIDFFINLSSSTEQNFRYVTFPMSNMTYIISNRQRPLGDIQNLQTHKIGFLKDSVIYEEYKTTVNHAYFFETVEEALEAVENQEIDAFVTRIGWVLNHLVHQHSLRLEFSLQRTVANLTLFTAKEELYDVLDIFKEITTTERMNIFRNRLELSKITRLEQDSFSYIQNAHASTISNYEVVKIGHHEMNYPFIYFELTGASSGRYIDLLKLFQSMTGIRYEIQNERGKTNYDELFNQLLNQEIHFLFGIGNVHEGDELYVIESKNQDNIISIVKYDNRELERVSVANMKFGIVSSAEAAELMLGGTEYIIFADYDAAVEALQNDEIDILIGRESILRYYQHVHDYVGLMGINVITGPNDNNILGNSYHVELNALFADVKRLYELLEVNQSSVSGKYQDIDYQMRYLNMREEHQLRTRITNFAIGGAVITLSAFGVSYALIRIHKKNEALRIKAETDELTGLYNKNIFQAKCEALIAGSPDKLGVFFFIDLDDLKLCNDKYGHIMGDKLLQEFAEVLKKMDDWNTVSFRIAGDEFGIFRVGLNNYEEILQMISQMKQVLKTQLKINDEITIPIHFSAGGSIYNFDTTDFNELKNFADIAMYYGKSAKKQLPRDQREVITLNLFEPKMMKSNSNQIMDDIITKKQLYPIYQAVHGIENENIYGYEGLSRITNSNISNIIEGIELAYEQGKLRELDLLMMETTLRGFGGTGVLFINMEYKTSELIEEYIEHMVNIANEINHPLSEIGIEISERRQWEESTIRTINQLKAKYGFLISIDDFGAGFANNYLLLQLKPDIVKIDRSLVCDISQNKEKSEYLKTLTEFIEKQNMKIIYEGVEVVEELNVLQEMSKDFVQGWYFGKPQKQIPNNFKSSRNLTEGGEKIFKYSEHNI